MRAQRVVSCLPQSSMLRASLAERCERSGIRGGLCAPLPARTAWDRRLRQAPLLMPQGGSALTGLIRLPLRLRNAAFGACLFAMLSAVARGEPTPTPEPTATPAPVPTPTATPR